MDQLFAQILSGLATGGIYASVALALVMIYQATHLVNFAQGELAMFATYLAWALIQAGVPYWGAFAITVISAFVGGVLIERIIIRPVENAPILAVVIVFSRPFRHSLANPPILLIIPTSQSAWPSCLREKPRWLSPCTPLSPQLSSRSYPSQCDLILSSARSTIGILTQHYAFFPATFHHSLLLRFASSRQRLTTPASCFTSSRRP